MRTFNSQDLEALEKDATGHPDYSDPAAFPVLWSADGAR